MNKANKRHQQPNQAKSKQMCPFVPDPYEDCYCYDMNSQEKIIKAIHYCGEKFEECEIYISHQVGSAKD
ncbi:MAG: hypothetical protein JRI28_03705 [Deltaproteobacteria bacterium]|nr:hypothetical protein [Deltaproteobacteria bacterium]